MTTQAQVLQAHVLVQELNQISQAQAIVAAPGAQFILEMSAPGMAGVRISVVISPTAVTPLLTARQTALQTQLTALGVTL